jgi:hypothetical protein
LEQPKGAGARWKGIAKGERGQGIEVREAAGVGVAPNGGEVALRREDGGGEESFISRGEEQWRRLRKVEEGCGRSSSGQTAGGGGHRG